MRLIVGLGNPGEAYAATRHNIGVMAVEHAAARWGIPMRVLRAVRRGDGSLGSVPVVLAHPLAWMNLNGPVVSRLLEELGLSPRDLIVVHDDVDLPVGRLRFKRTGGSGGHNGIRSVCEALGTGEFFRLRVGVGRPAPGEDTADYVLAPFRAEEVSVIEAALEQAVDALACAVQEGIETAMNRFNVRVRQDAGS
ncbi:aminoacyl-tRNA hydrolase [Candidatus Nitrospira bockiana]